MTEPLRAPCQEELAAHLSQPFKSIKVENDLSRVSRPGRGWPRIQSCQVLTGIPDSHHDTSPGLTPFSFPICLKGYLVPSPSPAPPNSSPSIGKKSMQAELLRPAVGTGYRAMLRIPHPLSKGQKVRLELAALSGPLPAVSRLPIYFPF